MRTLVGQLTELSIGGALACLINPHTKHIIYVRVLVAQIKAWNYCSMYYCLKSNMVS